MTEQERRDRACLWRRREAIAERMRQLKADVDHYNEYHNPGPDIVIDYDLTADIEELAAKRKAESK
jgi:hypothetical protein